MPTQVNLVSTSSVRAVLGVSAKELTDAVLASPIYSTRLKEDLLDVHPQIVVDFARVAALPSPSSVEQRFLDLIESYAAYNVAKQCLGALPMFAPLTIMDEKAELTRNADFYANIKQDVISVLALMRTRLQVVYALVNAAAPAPAAVVPIYAVSVGLAIDPLTGV